MKEFVVCYAVLLMSIVSGYIPASTPVSYCTNKTNTGDVQCQSDIEVFVNRLTSLNTLLPYEYPNFDFCLETNKLSLFENLGQVVMGDRIRPSTYKIKFNESKTCERACEAKIYKHGDKDSKAKLDFLKKGIKLNYQHHWIIDNMPVAWCYVVAVGTGTQTTDRYCSTSFPIGCYVTKDGHGTDACVTNAIFDQKDTYYVFNHVDIEIEYYQDEHSPVDAANIVFVMVTPRSIRHTGDDCHTREAMGISGETSQDVQITYTYSVKFKVRVTPELPRNYEIKWWSRWDQLLLPFHNEIQTMSMINSLVVIFFLSLSLALIMLKKYYQCCSLCKRTESSVIEEKPDWSLVRDHVFRTPANGMLLSVFLGSGIQIVLVCMFTLIVADTGFLYPGNRGYLAMCVMVIFMCTGILGGFVSTGMYKKFGGRRMILNALLNALLCPGLVFGIFLVVNLIYWVETSSAALPLSAASKVVGVWLGLIVPMTLAGSFLGYKRTCMLPPVVSDESDQISTRRFCKRTVFSLILGGILPFGVIFIQTFFILNSIWAHVLYARFGFLSITFFLLIITIAEVTVLSCYLNLSARDYYWRWRAFLSSGFSATYFLLYTVQYFVTKMAVQGPMNTFLYFSFTFIMAFLFFLLTGTIGFFACFLFINKMVSQPKSIDVAVIDNDETVQYTDQPD